MADRAENVPKGMRVTSNTGRIQPQRAAGKKSHVVAGEKPTHDEMRIYTHKTTRYGANRSG